MKGELLNGDKKTKQVCLEFNMEHDHITNCTSKCTATKPLWGLECVPNTSKQYSGVVEAMVVARISRLQNLHYNFEL
jgi:hypothetical protein